MWSRRKATVNFLYLTSLLTKGWAEDNAVFSGGWPVVNLPGLGDWHVQFSLSTDETSVPVSGASHCAMGSILPVFVGLPEMNGFLSSLRHDGKLGSFQKHSL